MFLNNARWRGVAGDFANCKALRGCGTEPRVVLASLPRINEFAFASTGKAGRIAETRASHAKALQSAGIDGLTIHGVRRSFSQQGECAGAPAGAIAQVMPTRER